MFVVEIIFDSENATEKKLALNEIYPPIIETQKIIDPSERSVYQLLEQYVEGTSHNPLAYRASKKAHVTMLKKKKILPMYLVHLAFVIKRAGWKVTKIHAHLTFEQKRFKEKFVIKIKNQGNYVKITLKKIFIN